jgi:hypothetical protein
LDGSEGFFFNFLAGVLMGALGKVRSTSPVPLGTFI